MSQPSGALRQPSHGGPRADDVPGARDARRTPRTVRPGPMLAVLLTGQAMASMDGSIAAVAAPAIRQDLGGSGAVQQLVLGGYTLAFAVLVVTGARLGSRYGYARVFTAGLAGFTLASLGCGLAPGPVALVTARAVQGCLAALMVPQVLSLIQRHFVGTARTRAIGRYAMVLALGVAGGQIAGGLLLTLDLGGLTWRAAFLVNVPIGVVLLLARRLLPAAKEGGPAGVPATAPETAVPRPAGGGDGSRLDLAGVALLSMAMMAVVLPLVAGREFGWSPGEILVPLVAGGVLLVAFGAYERRLGRRGGDPLLDLTVLEIPGTPAALLACYLIMGGYAGLLFTLTLRLQDGIGLRPFAAGLAFVPYATGFALCGLTAARLPDRVRGPLPVAGPLVLAGVAASVAWASRDGWPWLPASVLLLAGGVGHAAGFSPLVARVSARVPATAEAALSALVSTGTLLASVLGVAGIGGVYLALAGADGGRSAAGFGAAVAIVGGLLLVGAAAALSATRRGTAGPAGAPPGPAGAAGLRTAGGGRGTSETDSGRRPGRAEPGEGS